MVSVYDRGPVLTEDELRAHFGKSSLDERAYLALRGPEAVPFATVYSVVGETLMPFGALRLTVADPKDWDLLDLRFSRYAKTLTTDPAPAEATPPCRLENEAEAEEWIRRRSADYGILNPGDRVQLTVKNLSKTPRAFRAVFWGVTKGLGGSEKKAVREEGFREGVRETLGLLRTLEGGRPYADMVAVAALRLLDAR